MKNKIRVFYAVQVSNFTKIDGIDKWLIRNDACTNIAIGIISTILEKYPDDFEFVMKLPFMDDCHDINNYKELFDSKYLDRITFYEEHIPISPVTSRYNFDMSYHRIIGCGQKGFFNRYRLDTIDVMINDENTLTKNWRAFFDSVGNTNIKIISTNYFLDSPIAKKVPEKIRYYERQMESFIASDIAAFQCEAGRVEAMEAYDILFKSTEFLAHQSVWGIGAHYAEISKYHTKDKFEIPIIYFGNRISDTANRYTNYDSFAEAMGILSQIPGIKPFRAVMLNPTRKVTHEQLELIRILSNGVVEVMPNDEKFTREDYLKFINRAHISCNLFVTEVHGGVTHCEAMMAKNMVVFPMVNNYLHKMTKAGHIDYPLFVSIDDQNAHKPNVYDIALKCELALNAIGTVDEDSLRETCHSVGYEYESYERACDRIVNDIKSLIESSKPEMSYN